MSERRLIQTLAVGDYTQSLLDLSKPGMMHYAFRADADFQVCIVKYPHPEITDEFTQIQLTKLDLMRHALKDFDRVLWLDADVIVRPDAPDLFDLVPPTHWAGLDEGALFEKHRIKEKCIDDVHDHMKQVCEEDGLLFPDTEGRYFNCGVQLAAQRHAFLYEPAKKPQNHGWAEQSRINVRLFLRRDVPIYYLPECWNRITYLETRNYQRTSYFVHYAWAPYSVRPGLMKRDLEIWKETYGI